MNDQRMRFCLLAFALLIPAITITAVSVTVAGCVAEVASEAPDDTDTVTLQEAMASIGAADVELFGHSIGKGRSGYPAVRPTTDSPPTCGTK